MVKPKPQKRTEFRSITQIDRALNQYMINLSESQAYIRGVKKDILQLVSAKKDLKNKNNAAVSIGLNPLQ